MGIGITEAIPTAGDVNFEKALHYMGFKAGQKLLGTKVDYVFLGACTNGRIEDFRAFAQIAKGRKKAQDIIAWLVPGSWAVDRQIREEGIDKILKKCGEEATEITIAAKNPDAEELKYEIADYLYHLMVLMVECDVDWNDIVKELANRRK